MRPNEFSEIGAVFGFDETTVAYLCRLNQALTSEVSSLRLHRTQFNRFLRAVGCISRRLEEIRATRVGGIYLSELRFKPTERRLSNLLQFGAAESVS